MRTQFMQIWSFIVLSFETITLVVTIKGIGRSEPKTHGYLWKHLWIISFFLAQRKKVMLYENEFRCFCKFTSTHTNTQNTYLIMNNQWCSIEEKRKHFYISFFSVWRFFRGCSFTQLDNVLFYPFAFILALQFAIKWNSMHHNNDHTLTNQTHFKIIIKNVFCIVFSVLILQSREMRVVVLVFDGDVVQWI